MLAPLTTETLPPADALLDPALAKIEPPSPALFDAENTTEPLLEIPVALVTATISPERPSVARPVTVITFPLPPLSL